MRLQNYYEYDEPFFIVLLYTVYTILYILYTVLLLCIQYIRFGIEKSLEE